MVKLLNSFLGLLESKQKYRFLLLLLFMVFYAGIEMGTVAVLSGYVTSLIDAESFTSSSYFKRAELFFTFLTKENLLLYLSALVLFMIFLKNILKLILVYSVSRYASNISFDVGKYLTLGFLHMPYEWYMKQKISDLGLVIQWRSQVGMMVASVLNIISDFILAIIMLAAVIYFSSTLSILVICIIGFLGFAIFTVVKKYIDLNALILKDKSLNIHRATSRAMYGFKEMKIYGMEEEALRSYIEPAESYSNANVMKDFYVPFPALVLETIGISVLVFLVIVAVEYQNQSGAQITSVLTVVVLIMWRTLPAVGRIIGNFTKFRKVLPVVRTIEEYVLQITSQKSLDNVFIAQEGWKLKEKFDVKGLSFQYKGSNKKALDKIDFSLSKGESIGIVGPSGSGKSTLADLLVGLLQPNTGSLFLERKEIPLDKHLIKFDRLSYVSQSPFFFDGTLAENISFSIDYDRIDFALLQRCCSMAALDEMLEALPDGYETLIGERGVRLSGGQLQRIAIARALYREPNIILFDESTSSLDLKSEKAIQETINQLSGDITLIIIAHRLETVEKCDTIVWIEDGLIVETGLASEVLPKYKKKLCWEGN